jgi:hypothetical protein
MSAETAPKPLQQKEKYVFINSSVEKPVGNHGMNRAPLGCSRAIGEMHKF